MSVEPESQRPELRAELLAAARRAFLSRPYDEVRVDDIVEDAGVAKGLAFYYFKSKRGLYLAVLTELVGQLVASTRPNPDLPPRRREVAAVESFVEWVQTVEGIEIILSSWSAGDAEINAVLNQAAEMIISQMVAAMSDMPGGPGTEDELPLSLLSRSIWGWLAYARIVTADWLRKRDMEPEQLRDLLVGALDGVVAAARTVAAEAR